MTDADALIERLRARAADPDRRVDVGQNQFMAGVSAMDLGGLLGMLGSVSGDLQRVVAANQSGAPIDPEIHARTEALGAAMSTPVATSLPPPASPEAVAAAESRLGILMPPFLRRVYLEVADGGFGPGGGLLGVSGAIAALERIRTGDELPRGRSWPDALLPVVERDPGFSCVDCSTPDGRVVDWDPEALAEFSSENAFAASFADEAPSVEAWLETWAGAKTQAEQHAEMMQDAMTNAMAQSRAHFAAMTPEQKAAFGLTDDEWAELIGGGSERE
jgi:hypothetical protein